MSNVAAVAPAEVRNSFAVPLEFAEVYTLSLHDALPILPNWSLSVAVRRLDCVPAVAELAPERAMRSAVGAEEERPYPHAQGSERLCASVIVQEPAFSS